MVRIGTHNSATGEAPNGVFSFISIPFARTQSKTITEQFENKCRMFDLRVKRHKNEWKCAHGLFITKKTIWDILDELNFLAQTDEENPVIVNITYEGRLKDREQFIKLATDVMNIYRNIQFGDFFTKYPKWQKVFDGNLSTFYEPNENYKQYKPLDFSSWHTLIPIPWLWKQFYYKHPTFNEKSFTLVDFL